MSRGTEATRPALRLSRVEHGVNVRLKLGAVADNASSPYIPLAVEAEEGPLFQTNPSIKGQRWECSGGGSTAFIIRGDLHGRAVQREGPCGFDRSPSGSSAARSSGAGEVVYLWADAAIASAASYTFITSSP